MPKAKVYLRQGDYKLSIAPSTSTVRRRLFAPGEKSLPSTGGLDSQVSLLVGKKGMENNMETGRRFRALNPKP